MSQTEDSASGVNYFLMDRFKVECQIAAMKTSRNMLRRGFKELTHSRGESAFQFQPLPNCTFHSLAFVDEGLGTKIMVSDAMTRKLKRPTGYASNAQCTIAMAVNDLITLGALPVVVSMHLAVGDEHWFDDEDRWQALIAGWVEACNTHAHCTWGPGETPALKPMVEPSTAVLNCAAIGVVRDEKHCINSERIRPGDSIILFESSGIHANGLTRAREVASLLLDDYTTIIPGQTYTFGEALLRPTIIYVPVMEECQRQNVPINYAVNITGHGMRKIMRAIQPHRYVIDKLAKPQPEFGVIQEKMKFSDRKMYEAFNMGMGFAKIVKPVYEQQVIDISGKLGIHAWKGGHVEKADKHSIVLTEKNVEYDAETLNIR